MATQNWMKPISQIPIGKPQGEIEERPQPIAPPVPHGKVFVDENVLKSFPVPNTLLVNALNYGESLWGKTAKVITKLPSGKIETYFLKIVTLGETGRHMCEGEYESLKAIYEVSPTFVPKPYAWGKYSQETPEIYFLLAEFRDVGEQPAEPVNLAARLADLHDRSVSPTGKFGFHIATCHARITQAVDSWEDSWCTLYSRHLGHVMELAKPILKWPEFDIVCRITLEKVVPRLLLPLQSDGRSLKPCLVHGDCWDGNTAMDMRTGEAFVFDACSFYGHNEYDTGNWRAPRHNLSNRVYIRNYKQNFPVSEPEEDWDARNLLYSLTFNIGNAIYIPGSNQRQVIFDDMKTLCKIFCPDDLNRELYGTASGESTGHSEAGAGAGAGAYEKSSGSRNNTAEEVGEEGEEEEEEEEEEEQ